MFSSSPLTSPPPLVPVLLPASSANTTLQAIIPPSPPPAQADGDAAWAIWSRYEPDFQDESIWTSHDETRDLIADILQDILRDKLSIPDNVFEPDQQFRVRTEAAYVGGRLDVAATMVRAAGSRARGLSLGANICLIAEIKAAGAGVTLEPSKVQDVDQQLRDRAKVSADAGIPVGNTLIMVGFVGPFFKLYHWRSGRVKPENSDLYHNSQELFDVSLHGFSDLRDQQGQGRFQRLLGSFGTAVLAEGDLDGFFGEDGTDVDQSVYASPATHTSSLSMSEGGSSYIP